MKISKNVGKVIGFWLGLFVMLGFLSLAFNRDRNIYDMNSVKCKDSEIDAEEDNSIEVIFCGDSECYSTFCPLQMYQEYGFTSYVCATSAQRLCDTYAILENAFKTQNPKVVVLETNCLYRTPTAKCEEGDSVMRLLTNYMPVFAYHSDWKNFGGRLLEKGKGMSGREFKGFVLRKSVVPYTGGAYMDKTDAVEKFPNDTYGYLDKILKLCQENNARLMLVSVPSPKNWSYERHNGVMEWTEMYDVAYVDLNLEHNIDIDWLTDTKDGGDHLNFVGAKKVSRFMGGYLADKYTLSDRRKNPDYKTWEDCISASGEFSFKD
ncbi:MAG: hypothetical protein NC240_01555 [Clostridium sp.]|nr:hypothetical protein [Clostridium sp.]